ncbi:MAG: VanW family protein [Eubacteriales bacterium]|nr:VanW family protein [Eubacteriales bacterium]
MYQSGNAGRASGAVPARRTSSQGSSSSRGSGSGGGRRSGSSGGGKKKRTLRLQRLLKLALCVLGGLLVVVAVLLLVTRKPQEQTAAEYEEKGTVYNTGVTVNGVSVAGMTINEARDAVSASLNEELASINISIQESTGSFSLSAADMGITTDIDDVLAEAMYFSATGGTGEGEMQPEGSDGARDFDIALNPDEDAIAARLDELVLDENVAPIEPYAVAELSEENVPQFEYFEGTDGRILDKEASVEAIVQLIKEGKYNTTAELAYTLVPPTTELSYIQQNTQFRAKFTTRYKRSSSDQVVQNRCYNVEKGSGLLNGCIVLPGEEFSFNGYVGLRTEAAGWKLANGISGGKEYTLQAGGGICQVSTTLYNALLCGDVTVTDRKAHSIPSDYVPKGLDATVDSSGIDLKFVNSTNAPLYVFSYITKDPDSSRYLNITVELYGEPLPEGVTYKTRSEITEEIPREADTVYTESAEIPAGYQMTTVIKHDGYVAEAYVDKYQDGKVVDTKSLGTNKYRGNAAEISVGTGDPALIPVPEGAVPYTGGYIPPAA